MTNKNIVKLALLHDNDNLHINTLKSLEELNLDYTLINLDSNDWLDVLRQEKFDGVLVRSNPKSFFNLSFYNEVVYVIENHLEIPVDPSFNELYVYENKRMMYYWLAANGYNHTPTWIFKDKKLALSFLKSYPASQLVFKSATGSGASGVKIVSKSKAKLLTRLVFTNKLTINIGFIRFAQTRWGFRRPILNDIHYDHVIFQEKLNILVEWRIIKIGESYFGHQKLDNNGYHSGSNLVGWVKPSTDLLDLVKSICEKGKFNTMNVDIFETVDGKYYVNELQTHFGSYNPSQMYVDGIPGRFTFDNNEWVFEKGVFNRNGSTLLRLESFLKNL